MAARLGRAAALGAAAAVLLAGCGGSARRSPRPGPGAGLHGAEPAVSPPLLHAPAGRVVAVGAGAEGIVADPPAGVLAVAVRSPDRIVLFSLGTGRVVRRVVIAGPARHLALDGPGRLLVPEAPIDRLLTLRLPGGSAVGPAIRTGSLPHDAAAAGGRVWVADEFGHAVSVVRGGRVVGRVGGFTQPGGITTVGSHAVGLVDVSANELVLIDAPSGRVLARASAGGGPTHDVTGPSDVVYVADTRGGAAYAFAARVGAGAGTSTGADSLRRLGRLALPGRPYGIALDPRRDRLWVTVTATNTLAEIAVTRRGRMRVLARYPTVRQPNSVAVDARSGRVFVAGAAAGVVEEITPGPAR